MALLYVPESISSCQRKALARFKTNGSTNFSESSGTIIRFRPAQCRNDIGMVNLILPFSRISILVIYNCLHHRFYVFCPQYDFHFIFPYCYGFHQKRYQTVVFSGSNFIPEFILKTSYYFMGRKSGFFCKLQSQRQISKHFLQLSLYDPLNILCRDLMHRTFCNGPFVILTTQIVKVSLTATRSVCRHHCTAAVTTFKNIFQWGYNPLPVFGFFVPVILFQDFLNSLPYFAGNNCLLFAFANRIFVLYLSNICMIVEHPVNMITLPWITSLCTMSGLIKFACDQFGRLNFNKALKYRSDNFCIFLFYYKFLIYNDISKRNSPADKHAFFAAGFHFILYSLSNNFALELAEGDQNIQHHTPGRGRCINFLCYCDKLDAPLIKFL